jgi:hypothetical protein
MTLWAKYASEVPYALMRIEGAKVQVWNGQAWIDAPPAIALEVTGIGGENGWEPVSAEEAEKIRSRLRTGGLKEEK